MRRVNIYSSPECGSCEWYTTHTELDKEQFNRAHVLRPNMAVWNREKGRNLCRCLKKSFHFHSEVFWVFFIHPESGLLFRNKTCRFIKTPSFRRLSLCALQKVLRKSSIYTFDRIKMLQQLFLNKLVLHDYFYRFLKCFTTGLRLLSPRTVF